jgi:Peptidase A4 family
MELSPAERKALTKDMLAKNPPVVVPPEGFDVSKASNTELVQNGLPPRPDKTTSPKLRAKWERIMSRPLKYIKPEFAVGDIVHFPIDNNSNNNIWSGAVIPSPPSGNTFKTISASWVVPNAYPPSGATGNKTYQCSSWVGIDGYGISELLQCGTDSWVTVNGSTVTQGSYAWYEWFPSGSVVIQNFPTKPGDLIHATVCGDWDSDPKSGRFALTNLSANISTPLIAVSAPTQPNTTTLLPLQGRTAEWITEDPSYETSTNPPVYTPVPFQDYGAVFYADAAVSSSNASGGNVVEQNLSNATVFLNIAQGTPLTTLSTAVEENPTVLETYAFTNS